MCGGLQPVRDSTLDRWKAVYAKTAGIKNIRIHDFRHSHASLLANEGINIQEIARRLGHSKIEITWNTYAHLYPREEERAIAILNKIVYRQKIKPQSLIYQGSAAYWWRWR
ncbi:MAG: tyrosine-type recombinase/integrase [Oscillospiraceae bacterium]|nr:tyrosine-type recombinase/integrase [Oscillospiraceae bacterium]